MRPQRAIRSVLSAVIAAVVLITSTGTAHGAAGFGDVGTGRFYTTAVQWMVDNDITTGTAPGCYSPGREVTRAEIATFLHRLAGEPAGGSEPFVDVAAGAYYRDAVAWMVSAGITTGTGPNTFEPDRAVSRAEVATFLHRYAGSPTPTGLSSIPFVDTPDGAFFDTAVAWMVSVGITTGTSPTTFEPYRAVTRAEAATFLHRLVGAPQVTVDPGGHCTSPVRNDIANAEAVSFELLTHLRDQVGAGSLVRDPAMDEFARNWSRQMSEGGFFQHSGGPYGENIVWWSQESLTPEQAAQKFHDMWVDSAGHYANMIQAGYTKVGVGLWRDENGWHGTHVFSY